MTGKSFNAEMIGKVYKVFKFGGNTLEARDVLGIDPTTASRYYRAFRQMENGESVDLSRVCSDEFKIFAKAKGFKCKFVEQNTQNNVETPSNCVSDDSTTLEEISKTLISMRNVLNYMLKYMKVMSESWGGTATEENGGDQ